MAANIWTDERRKKQSEALKARWANGCVLKGGKHSDETKARMSKAHKGVSRNKGMKHSQAYKDNLSQLIKGQANPNWRGGISAVTRTERANFMNTPEYKAWRKAVFERDDYTCQDCGDRGVKLHADHKLPYSRYPEKRLDVDNGRTLCVPCHIKTPTFGTKALKENI